jgi:hypothetical protein
MSLREDDLSGVNVEPLDQLVRVLGEALEALASVRALILSTVSSPAEYVDPEYAAELMRLKDDGCPNGD